MSTITIKIENKKKLDHFLAFIKDLDFIEIVDKTDLDFDQLIERKNSEDDFFGLAGMWENRDTTSSDLRSKAWPKRN
jgi:hypothetical protein